MQLPKSRLEAAPWGAAGLVTLLDMLKYAADDFYKLAVELKEFEQLPMLARTPAGRAKLQDCINRLCGHCDKLKLESASKQIHTLIAAFDARENMRQLQGRFQELQVRIIEDLEGKVCFCLPSEKVEFWHPFYLVKSAIYDNFPSAWKEFQRAGKCYAFGEGAACAFHLQRALECGLKALAVDLGQRFDRHSWDAHLKDIERELKSRYGSAAPRTAKEKIYSEAATLFGHMKVAWRNPTMHIEAQYDDGEAKNLLDAIVRFMEHLAKNGIKEPE